MEVYEFNAITDRRNTNCLKWDFAVERGRPSDVLPLWVADMDFPAPPAVQEALHKAVSHGIFGYSDTKEDYFQAVSQWFQGHFGWKTQPEWLVKTPGVVYALAMAVQAFTQPGQSVLIQPPVYYPFFSVIQDNDRRLVESPLVHENGRYSIDFDDFERKVVEEQVKLFLLCSPHNPVGRVWTVEELRKIGSICQKHGVIVVSDEIHCDFALPGHPHTIFPAAVPELAEQTVVCTAPSKSFNLAGLQTSNIWIQNPQLRAAFCKQIDRSGYSQLNGLGLVACQAAYESGGEWLEQCKDYLRDNLEFVREYLAQNLPEIKLVEPEGTYFAWLDCSQLGLSQEALDDLVVNKAKLWLDAGHIFGGGADQFQRMVLACPRSILEQALKQLENAVHR
jgi:cystathionine beta-lyase